MEHKLGGKGRIAQHWHALGEQGKVVCDLCPRHCSLKPEQLGFCRVRGNEAGQLLTYNYGKSVDATIETIETEAIYHYMPGAKIVSMGNVGCMMGCSFCQNWQTSQMKHLNVKNVKDYTPEEVVQLAIDHEIPIISWTYNDPVVWHEFVLETSRLAKEKGIKTLYKSALYIEEKPLAELIEVIDIFSISLKTMSDEVYRKVTKGRLEPVLRGIKQIYDSDKHLEISQLVVTGLNDDGEDARKTAKWIVDTLDASVPLHFVGYHPAFRYHKERTPLSVLLESRRIAKEAGIRYCYLGNVYEEAVSNTTCSNCGTTLIERFGLTVNDAGIDEDCTCKSCSSQTVIKGKNKTAIATAPEFHSKNSQTFSWHKEAQSLHIAYDQLKEATLIKVVRFPGEEVHYFRLSDGLERVILSKENDLETHIEVSSNNDRAPHLLPVLDRAHFPVISLSKNVTKYKN